MEISISGPKDFYLSIYHIAQEAREKGVVFYGAGFWGDFFSAWSGAKLFL